MMAAIVNGVTSSDALDVVSALLNGHAGSHPTILESVGSIDANATMNDSAAAAPVAILLQQLFNITLTGNGTSSVAIGQLLTALSPFLASFTPFVSFSPLLTALAPLLTAFYPLIQTFLKQYLHNDFFAGSLWLAVLLFGGRFLLTCLSYVWDWFRHQGMVSVCVSPNDEAFTWIQEWLNTLPKLKSADLILSTRWDADENTGILPDRPRLLFLPKLKNAQRIYFKGSLVTFQMRNSPNQSDGGGGGDLGELLRNMGKEELVIEARSRAVVEGVVQAAMDSHLKKRDEQKRTCIRRWACDMNCWQYLGDRPIRPFSSVIVDIDTANLLSDAKRFASSSKWYSDRGIPHRRGYLFHGPPGCGKTSLIQALAGEMDYDVCVISLSGSGMNDDMLHTAMSDGTQRSVFILEDVDAAFSKNRATNESSRASGLSFSGLLNAIDGVSAQEGRLLVMTTNHIERLDPALIRPGRIDVRLHLDLASRSQIARLFLRFYPEGGEDLAKQFAAHFEEKSVSPASLQGYFLMHRDDAQDALAHVEEYVEQERKAKEERESKKNKEAEVKKEVEEKDVVEKDREVVEVSVKPEEGGEILQIG